MGTKYPYFPSLFHRCIKWFVQHDDSSEAKAVDHRWILPTYSTTTIHLGKPIVCTLNLDSGIDVRESFPFLLLVSYQAKSREENEIFWFV